MTHPTPPTCPECGAARLEKDDLLFECGSVDKWSHEPFVQSDACRIASLTRQLAERDAALATILSYVKSAYESAHDKSAMLVFLVAAMDRAKSGQPLLDKLSRLERVADGLKKMKASGFSDGNAAKETWDALAALESKGET